MRKRELFVVGTGGLAKEIAFILEYLEEYRLIGFVSNEKEKGIKYITKVIEDVYEFYKEY